METSDDDRNLQIDPFPEYPSPEQAGHTAMLRARIEMVTERGSCRLQPLDELGELSRSAREFYWRAKIHNLGIKDKVLLIAWNYHNKAVWVNALAMAVMALILHSQWDQLSRLQFVLGLILLFLLDSKICRYVLTIGFYRTA